MAVTGQQTELGDASNSTPQRGSYSALDVAGNATGSGYTLKSDATGVAFVDFFEGTETASWSGVSFTALGATQFMSVRSRAGNQTQQYTVNAYAAGTSTLVATTDITRYRQTGWTDTAFMNSASKNATFGSLATGTYDFEVVSLNGGSHLADFGVFTPSYNLALGSTRLEADQYSWMNNANNLQTGDGAATDGIFLDNRPGSSAVGDPGNWLDFELNNPNAAWTYDFDIAARKGAAGTTTYSLSSINSEGDETLLTSASFDAVTGWGGTAFTEYAGDGTFTLPEGVQSLRLRTSGTAQHLDYIDLTATIPEPATIGMLGFGALLVFIFRRMRG